jgi:hypothetical protein
MLNQGTGYTIEDLEFLAVCGASSKARRYLAESVGRLYEAYDLWSDAAHPSLDLWVKSCNLLQSLTNCSKKIGMTDTTFSIGEAHGAAFLGAWSIRAFRLRATQEVALSTAIET